MILTRDDGERLGNHRDWAAVTGLSVNSVQRSHLLGQCRLSPSLTKMKHGFYYSKCALTIFVGFNIVLTI